MSVADSMHNPLSQKSLVATPSKYDGNKKENDTFLRQIQLFIRGNTAILSTDEKKITVALSYIEGGDAEIWANGFTDAKLTAGDFGTWKDFLDEFKQQFGPTTTESDAITELENLYQDKLTATEYWMQANALIGRAKLRKKEDYVFLKRIITTRMNWPLIRQCFALDNVPATYENWQSQTIKFDNQWREANDIRAQSKRKDDRKPKKSPYIPRAQESIQDLGEPMDVDSRTTKREKPPIKAVRNFLTDIERTDLMKRGACFKCKQIGHLSRDCPGQGRSDSCSDNSGSRNERTQNIRSMDTIPAPSLSTDDKDAMIAALMDKIDRMEKTLTDRKDF